MTPPIFKVASIGIGWWSNVLADAVLRTKGRIQIVSCYTRSVEKRREFAKHYGCKAASNYDEILADPEIDGIINTTPNHAHLETTAAAAAAGKHVFLDKPIANSISDAKAITHACEDGGVVLSVGYQRRRESHFPTTQSSLLTSHPLAIAPLMNTRLPNRAHFFIPAIRSPLVSQYQQL